MPVTVFQQFIQWLHFGSTPKVRLHTNDCLDCDGSCACPLEHKKMKKLRPEDKTPANEAALEAILENTRSIVHLYAFAVVYDIPRLREQIVNETWWLTTSTGQPHVQEVLFATQLLPKTSLLHKLLVDAFGMHFDSESLMCACDRLICHRLPAKVWNRFSTKEGSGSGKRKAPRIKNLCQYHEHGKDAAELEACRAKYRE